MVIKCLNGLFLVAAHDVQQVAPSDGSKTIIDVWGGSAQIIAGEEIENQFGARLGLSTLAAAGLGNLLSDICGLGLADQIEVRAPLHCRCAQQCLFQAI